MSELFAGRFVTDFTGYHITGGTMVEAFDKPERIGIRWNVETYGVERIEVTVKAKSALDQYDRMNSHFGGTGAAMQRLAVFDNLAYNCVSGLIVNLRPEGKTRVTYVAKGPGWNHSDQYGPTTVSASTDTTSDQLIHFLEDDVFILEDDMSNIEETSTTLSGWQPKQNIGEYPASFIEFAKKAGNSAGELWDYYCIDRPMQYGSLQDFTPYFINRASRTTVDWRVSVNDLSSLTLDSDMSTYRSASVVWFGTYTGTATGGSATQLQDSSEFFLAGHISVGDSVRNITDGSVARIRSIDSNTQMTLTTLTGGSSNTFSNTDIYGIESNTIFAQQSDQHASFTHLNRRIAEHVPELNGTQASQYATALLNFYGKPIQSAAFTISSPWIRDANGSKRPLWAPIFEGGGLIQITDLYPAAAVSLNQATNNLDTFFITAMDYDYTTNQLRIGVNVPDSRLDAKLAAAGILGSAGIARGGLR